MNEEKTMPEKALNIVRDYVFTHSKNAWEETKFFIAWQAKALQNWKFLISTDLCDGKYYELTFNGDKKEWYLDVYDKVENLVVKE